MASNFFLAIDQGTTGSTALVLDASGATRARATVEFPQIFPKPGWVEHAPSAILESVQRSIREALSKGGIDAKDIRAIGITNQRETTVVWNKHTGAPIANAIVWQCRRTADVCEKLRAEGKQEWVAEKTGLVLDAYFSGTKVAWLLDHTPSAREASARGDLLFGTIDTYLVYELTGRKEHVTDVTNASRTLLMDLASLSWDQGLCDLFRVPRSMLPRIVGCAEVVGHTKGFDVLPDGIPIAGIAGDQQAALFGQACFDVGNAKCTYGTGAFVLMNVGASPVRSHSGLLTTVAWSIGGKTSYALEGSSFIAGAAVQWLRDGLGLIREASEIEPLALSVTGSEGVSFVPALSGLGAPYWDPAARGVLSGLTRGTNKGHIARATLEGIAFQVWDLLAAMQKDSTTALRLLKVDGGDARNDLLMQFQSDVANVVVARPKDIESTARGAAMLAAIGSGEMTLESTRQMVTEDRAFKPSMSENDRASRLKAWEQAVKRAQIH